MIACLNPEGWNHEISLKIADNMLDLIGEIPWFVLIAWANKVRPRLLVKPELLNPSGSIKDRIAKRMIEEAEAQGLLHEMCRIIEATAGNTGTALAFVSAVKGYDFVAYVPDKIRRPLASRDHAGLRLRSRFR